MVNVIVAGAVNEIGKISKIEMIRAKAQDIAFTKLVRQMERTRDKIRVYNSNTRLLKSQPDRLDWLAMNHFDRALDKPELVRRWKEYNE